MSFGFPAGSSSSLSSFSASQHHQPRGAQVSTAAAEKHRLEDGGETPHHRLLSSHVADAPPTHLRPTFNYHLQPQEEQLVSPFRKALLKALGGENPALQANFINQLRLQDERDRHAVASANWEAMRKLRNAAAASASSTAGRAPAVDEKTKDEMGDVLEGGLTAFAAKRDGLFAPSSTMTFQARNSLPNADTSSPPPPSSSSPSLSSNKRTVAMLAAERELMEKGAMLTAKARASGECRAAPLPSATARHSATHYRISAPLPPSYKDTSFINARERWRREGEDAHSSSAAVCDRQRLIRQMREEEKRERRRRRRHRRRKRRDSSSGGSCSDASQSGGGGSGSSHGSGGGAGSFSSSRSCSDEDEGHSSRTSSTSSAHSSNSSCLPGQNKIADVALREGFLCKESVRKHINNSTMEDGEVPANGHERHHGDGDDPFLFRAPSTKKHHFVACRSSHCVDSCEGNNATDSEIKDAAGALADGSSSPFAAERQLMLLRRRRSSFYHPPPSSPLEALQRAVRRDARRQQEEGESMAAGAGVGGGNHHDRHLWDLSAGASLLNKSSSPLGSPARHQQAPFPLSRIHRPLSPTRSTMMPSPIYKNPMNAASDHSRINGTDCYSAGLNYSSSHPHPFSFNATEASLPPGAVKDLCTADAYRSVAEAASLLLSAAPKSAGEAMVTSILCSTNSDTAQRLERMEGGRRGDCRGGVVVRKVAGPKPKNPSEPSSPFRTFSSASSPFGAFDGGHGNDASSRWSVCSEGTVLSEGQLVSLVKKRGDGGGEHVHAHTAQQQEDYYRGLGGSERAAAAKRLLQERVLPLRGKLYGNAVSQAAARSIAEGEERLRCLEGGGAGVSALNPPSTMNYRQALPTSLAATHRSGGADYRYDDGSWSGEEDTYVSPGSQGSKKAKRRANMSVNWSEQHANEKEEEVGVDEGRADYDGDGLDRGANADRGEGSDGDADYDYAHRVPPQQHAKVAFRISTPQAAAALSLASSHLQKDAHHQLHSPRGEGHRHADPSTTPLPPQRFANHTHSNNTSPHRRPLLNCKGAAAVRRIIDSDGSFMYGSGRAGREVLEGVVDRFKNTNASKSMAANASSSSARQQLQQAEDEGDEAQRLLLLNAAQIVRERVRKSAIDAEGGRANLSHHPHSATSNESSARAGGRARGGVHEQKTPPPQKSVSDVSKTTHPSHSPAAARGGTAAANHKRTKTPSTTNDAARRHSSRGVGGGVNGGFVVASTFNV